MSQQLVLDYKILCKCFVQTSKNIGNTTGHLLLSLHIKLQHILSTVLIVFIKQVLHMTHSTVPPNMDTVRPKPILKTVLVTTGGDKTQAASASNNVYKVCARDYTIVLYKG